MGITTFIRCLPYLLAGAVAFYAAWTIQGGRVDSAKAAASKAQTALTACQDANKTNESTIEQLKKDAASANNLCVARVQIRTQLVDRIRQIDNIKQEKGTDETGNSNDLLLGELNRLWVGSKADRQD